MDEGEGATPVLVVDDNNTNLKLVSYLLSSYGYEVATAYAMVAGLIARQGGDA